MQSPKRSGIRRAGLVTAASGLVLAVSGVAITTAAAKEKAVSDTAHKVAVCHATSSVTNPYRLIEVDASATAGPDHSTHTGPVFDPEVNTSSKTPWGDIIPDGLNWTEAGIALWENHCQLPGEEPDPDPEDVCPEVEGIQADRDECAEPELVDVCVDLEGVQLDGGDCSADVLEPELVDECVDLEGVQVDGGDCSEGELAPEPTDACPNLAGLQASASECPPTQVGGLVVTRAPAPVSVLAATLTAPAQGGAAALPRTGSATVQLVQLGLGLVLLGFGAILFGREHAIA